MIEFYSSNGSKIGSFCFVESDDGTGITIAEGVTLLLFTVDVLG